jgi:hypothetical protein
MDFVMVTWTNSNLAVFPTFLTSLTKLPEDYFGPIDADILISNFSFVSELLEKMMDYGSPHTLGSSALGE